MADKSSLFIDDRDDGRQRLLAVVSFRNALNVWGPRTILNDLKDLDIDVYENLMEASRQKVERKKTDAAIFWGEF